MDISAPIDNGELTAPLATYPSISSRGTATNSSDGFGSSGATDEQEAQGFSGVHDVLKTVDYWFEREAHQIESEADRLSAQWAAENLPTLNKSDDGVLPPEEMLAKRCGALWRQWPERVQVKMQDAIDSAAAELAGRVSSSRAALMEIKLTRTQLAEAEGKIEDIRRETASTRGPVRYNRYFDARLTILLTVLLIGVEFVANQPVFRIIWPMQPDVANSLAEQVQLLATSGWFSGIKISALEALSYFEASMLAFAVVVLLFVLAKALGTALRPIVALRSQDYPFASRSIDSLHRQKRVLLYASGAGTLAVIIFLFLSRRSAAEVVSSRVDAIRSQVQSQQLKVDSLQRSPETSVSDEIALLVRRQDELMRLENELGFARTIASNNFSILILNCSLVCFALVVGFMSDERDLSDTMGEHPDLARLKDKCNRLRENIIRFEGLAREEISLGRLADSKQKSLLRSRPLASLEAKRQRLESIIPRWRTENARQRGLDPSSIAAFCRPMLLSLPEATASIALVKPDTSDNDAAELAILMRGALAQESDSSMKDLAA